MLETPHYFISWLNEVSHERRPLAKKTASLTKGRN